MTQKAVHDFSEFPALVVAAFVVRNAAVLAALTILAVVALTTT